MSEINYRKLAVVGHVGAGKTCLVETLSDISPVNTDVDSSVDIGKATTTVGIDYGRIYLDKETALGIYGVPGQSRYSFIWEMVRESLWGIVVLFRLSEDLDEEGFREWLDFFQVSENTTPCIIGISHCDAESGDVLSEAITKVQNCLADKQIMAPIIPLDPRDSQQAVTLLNTINALVTE